MILHSRAFQCANNFRRKIIENGDAEIDKAFPLPKDSPLTEFSESVRIESYGRKLTLIQTLEVKPHLTMGFVIDTPHCISMITLCFAYRSTYHSAI